MTTGDHTHDRPMVDWCSYWQVMAARSAETRPWWAVMAARSTELHKPGHSNPALPILQSNDGRQIQTIGD